MLINILLYFESFFGRKDKKKRKIWNSR